MVQGRWPMGVPNANNKRAKKFQGLATGGSSDEGLCQLACLYVLGPSPKLFFQEKKFLLVLDIPKQKRETKRNNSP